MSATRLRDELFSEIHATTLKPSGFRKNGRWVQKQEGLMHFALERPQQRFDSPESATFDPVVYIFHEKFHALAIGWPTFPGVDRMSIAAFRRGARWLAETPESATHLVPSADMQAMLNIWQDGITGAVLPLFDRARSLQGLLDVVRQHIPDSWIRMTHEAILLALLDQRAQAELLLEAVLDSQTNVIEREKTLELRTRLSHPV